MNKNVTFLFIVKNISCVQFSSCHISDENFLTSNFSQTTITHNPCKTVNNDFTLYASLKFNVQSTNLLNYHRVPFSWAVNFMNGLKKGSPRKVFS